MDPIAVFALIVWGLIVGMLPTFFLIETFHWILGKQSLQHPRLKGFFTGTQIGTLVTFLQIAFRQWGCMIGPRNGGSGLEKIPLQDDNP